MKDINNTAGGFTYKKLLWFKSPDPDFGNTTIEQYLAAEYFYSSYLNLRRTKDLNGLILCLYRSKKKFSMVATKRHSMFLNLISIKKRRIILQNFVEVFECLQSECPYAFFSLKAISKTMKSKSLLEAFIAYYGPDLKEMNIIKALWCLDVQNRDFYNKRDNVPPVLPEMFLNPDESYFQKYKFISKNEVLIKRGSILDPESN